MPSFFPREVPQQLPLTPPEPVRGYNPASFGPAQHPQTSFGSRYGRFGDCGYPAADRFGQHPPMTAHQPIAFHPAPSYASEVGRACYDLKGVSTLPQMQPQGRPIENVDTQHHQRRQELQEQQPKEEKVIGGVSAKLDYDMERMTDFVSEMAQGMYALLTSPICIADIDLIRSVQPGLVVTLSFRKWVFQVLCATRLPSATILQSLHYLSVRMTMLSNGGRFVPTEGQIYRLVTISLLLGSKFLDDNTFINRSWSEVSGIKVSELNTLELEWLVAIRFKLHRDPTEQQGFNTWRGHWQQYDARALARQTIPSGLRPLDTTVVRQQSPALVPPPSYELLYPRSALQESGAAPRNAQYAPHYPAYDSWSGRRIATDDSPTTATYTMPPTPDYSGGPWNSEGYSRRTMFGYPPLPPPQARPAAYSQTVFQQSYSPSGWNGHGVGCNCLFCQPTPYLITPPYGLQSVAG